ncbi:MAG: hypothetical protein CMO01_00555, partial [Thalassobius sp.]|nr:hypothetical protein [Thalassovita sp.]
MTVRQTCDRTDGMPNDFDACPGYPVPNGIAKNGLEALSCHGRGSSRPWPKRRSALNPDKLSPKALTVLASLHGIPVPATSGQIKHLAPQQTSTRDWALPTLRRLKDMGLVHSGPRTGSEMSFTISPAGRQLLARQSPEVDLEPRDEGARPVGGGHGGLAIRFLGAKRIIVPVDPACGTWVAGTPGHDVMQAVLQGEVAVTEAAACEPCLLFRRGDDGVARLLD